MRALQCAAVCYDYGIKFMFQSHIQVELDYYFFSLITCLRNELWCQIVKVLNVGIWITSM